MGVSHRWAAGLLTAMALAIAQPAAAAPETVRVPASQAAAAMYTLLGYRVSPLSCLVDPFQAKCPVVSEVVIQLPEIRADETVGTLYGPVTAPSQPKSSRSTQALSYDPGSRCAVIARDPTRIAYSSSQGIDYQMLTKGENVCALGAATYMSIENSLFQDNPNDSYGFIWKADGPYQWVGCCGITTDAQFNCNHPGYWGYVGSAYA